ncbi:FG-GAP-like repeat-containing protein [Thiorhodococcus minor]|uniref:Calx-beta domain-containing protein n=1 Tax=Thiorhodococcus minor TaxID=57489 RepID=A0A6M0JZC0_9GAMM|nr:FG-GAP-like repeat-containing protein [Thiorhodococcus minor]NEV62830.1 hypothetical protein [Thiorhodococcus minor]
MNRNSHHVAAAVLGLLALGLTLSSAAEMGPAQFAEARDELGRLLIDAQGETWGASWGDLNADGFPDLWLAMHQYTPTLLLQNLGDGRFANVTDAVVVDADAHMRDDTHGVAWADFDNDGDDDLVEACGGAAGEAARGASIDEEGRNNLFVNEAGRLWEQGEHFGVGYPRARGRTPSWVDFDNDGLLDLAITAQKTAEGQYPSALFRQGLAGFDDVSDDVGFTAGSCENALVSSLIPGRSPLLICADSSRVSAVSDTSTTPFTEVRSLLGDDLYAAYPFDLAIADFDGDLLPDVFGVVAPPITPAAARAESGDRIHATLHFSPEHSAVPRARSVTGFSFTAPDEARLVFGWETEAGQIHLGRAGLAPPAGVDVGLVPPHLWPHRVELALSPADPSLEGLPADMGEGIYVGRLDGRWHVRAVDVDHRLHVAAIAEGISQPEPYGDVSPSQGNRLPPILFRNEGGRLRRTATEATFLDPIEAIALYGRSLTPGDFDNDMDVDVYVGTTGNLANTPNALFENQGDGTFRLVAAAAGASGTLLGKTDTVTSVDFDLDGCLDLFVTQGAYPAPFSYSAGHQLFRNRCDGNHWIAIDLEGVTSNANAIGAVVYAYTPDGRVQMREQANGMHKYAQSYRRIHFGLGANSRVDLEVHWPSGLVERFSDLAVDRVARLREGSQGAAAARSLKVADVRLEEGADPGVATFAVALSPPPATGEQVEVAYRTLGESALEQADFLPVSGVLSFAAGESRHIVRVSILDDGQREDSETFVLELSGAATGTITRRATILDDDAAVTPECGAPEYDPGVDQAAFLWSDCASRRWHLRITGGGDAHYVSYLGNVAADRPLASVSAYSIEPNDKLTRVRADEIGFDLIVGEVYEDGVDFELDEEGAGCFSLRLFNELPVLLGPRRVLWDGASMEFCTE